MKKTIALLLAVSLLAILFAGCGKKEIPAVTPKTETEILKEIKGNYFNNDAIEMFRETKSAVDSFKGLYVMRIDENCQVMVGDGHQGASVGEIKKAEDKGENVYLIEAKKDSNNYFKGAYMPSDSMVTATLKTDFSGDGKEKNITYCKFSSDDEIIKTLSAILFENAEGAENENGSVFVKIDGTKYEASVTYSTVEVKTMYPDCMGAVILKSESGETISAAYKTEEDKIIIINEENNVLCSLNIK